MFPRTSEKVLANCSRPSRQFAPPSTARRFLSRCNFSGYSPFLFDINICRPAFPPWLLSDTPHDLPFTISRFFVQVPYPRFKLIFPGHPNACSSSFVPRPDQRLFTFPSLFFPWNCLRQGLPTFLFLSRPGLQSRLPRRSSHPSTQRFTSFFFFQWARSFSISRRSNVA